MEYFQIQNEPAGGQGGLRRPREEISIAEAVLLVKPQAAHQKNSDLVVLFQQQVPRQRQGGVAGADLLRNDGNSGGPDCDNSLAEGGVRVDAGTGEGAQAGEADGKQPPRHHKQHPVEPQQAGQPDLLGQEEELGSAELVRAGTEGAQRAVRAQH